MTQTTLLPTDRARIQTAQVRVKMLLSDGQPRTLAQIAAACQTSEAGASARVRALRRECRCGRDCATDAELAAHISSGMLFCGRYVIERARIGVGLFSYRLA